MDLEGFGSGSGLGLEPGPLRHRSSTGARRGLACSRAECCEQGTQRNVTGVWCVAARVWCAACARHGAAAPARREPAVEAAVVAHVAQHRDRKPRAVDDLELPDRIVGAHAEALPHLLHGDARLRRKVGTAANLQQVWEGKCGRAAREIVKLAARRSTQTSADTGTRAIERKGTRKRAPRSYSRVVSSRPSAPKPRGVRRPCHAWRTTAANGLRFLWT